MLDLIHDLGSDEWGIAAKKIYDALKPVLQTGSGLVKRIRVLAEEDRQATILRERAKFLDHDFVGDLGNLDHQIDDLATAIFEANYECQQGIYYDFVPRLGQLSGAELPEPVRTVLDYLLRGNDQLARYRLNMIIARLVNESAGQSNKSNAGSAGEFVGAAVLNAAGLVKDRDFRTQYKSSKGSDTDIVIPCVKDRQDQDVEVFIAVQLSTNDRARLASSELKVGAQKYLLTGNGLNVSKKRLQSIGHGILEGYSSDNIRLVCYGPEIAREVARLTQLRSKKKRDERLERRISYFESYAFSFTEFARKLRERYASQPVKDRLF